MRLAADDEQRLGVRLQPLHAVDDLRAGLLQIAGPLDVAGLVEPGLQLDDDRNVLAGLAGPDQSRDDLAVAAGPVQRLLDRQHIRIGRGLLDQMDDRVEALVWVHQQHIGGGDLGEQIAVFPEGRRRHLRPAGLAMVSQIVPHREPQEVLQIGRAVNRDHLPIGHAEPIDQQSAKRVSGPDIQLQADDAAATPGLEHRLHLGEQVERLLVVDGDVGIAGDAEYRRVANRAAGEEAAEKGLRQILEENVAVAAILQIGVMEPSCAWSERKDGEDRLAVSDAVVLVWDIVPIAPLQLDREAGRLGRQRGKRPPRHDGDWRKDRQDLVVEDPLQTPPRLSAKRVRVDPQHAGLRQQRLKRFAKQLVLVVHHPRRPREDRLQLLLGRQSRDVRHGRPPPRRAVQAADPHAEELVEVRRGDAEELQPFGEWDGRIGGLIEDPLVELQPGQLAVEEQVGGGIVGHGAVEFIAAAPATTPPPRGCDRR